MERQARPVKVLRLIARLNTGGPAIHTVLLTQNLNSNQFASRLITGMISPGEGDMGYYAGRRGVTPIVIPELGRDVSLRNDVRALWKVFRLMRREQPDVIHTHTAKAGGIGRLAAFLYNIGRRASGRSRTKVIHSFHGHIFRGYFSPWKSRLLVLIERLLALVTDRIIAVSEEVRRDLVDVYRVCPPEKVRVIPIGLDLNWVDEIPRVRGALREKFRIPRDRTVVAIVGRLTEIKNHRLFVSALGLLQDENLHAVIVGDGELRRATERRVAELKLQERVTFTGWQEDVVRVYADVDIVCLTSLNEGTPLALIEAMAAGRPIVATDVGGIRDLMIGQAAAHLSGFRVFENGILTPAGDEQALACALRFLIRRPDVREEQGRVGQRSAHDRYPCTRLVSDVAALYTEVLGPSFRHRVNPPVREASGSSHLREDGV